MIKLHHYNKSMELVAALVAGGVTLGMSESSGNPFCPNFIHTHPSLRGQRDIQSSPASRPSFPHSTHSGSMQEPALSHSSGDVGKGPVKELVQIFCSGDVWKCYELLIICYLL